MSGEHAEHEAEPNVDPQATQVLSTLNVDGSRRWIRPVLSPGRFLDRRRAVGYILIALFTLIPHVRINGKPPILIDLPRREFTFVGSTLYPTDTLLLALLLLSVFLTIFLLTALTGRVWCGWACPQTVYLELVYRPIERFFHGKPGHKPKPGAWRGPARFVTYLLVSAFLAHTFLAYFVPTDVLRTWIFHSPFAHPVGFSVVVLVTIAMMFDFGFFREQTCIVACPYGRLQSVLLDQGSVIVGYDAKRGEPRGKKRRKPKPQPVDLTIGDTDPDPLGDCIDCKMCVHTCPTGIDIRDGLQLECVQCAQCIDACDAIMDKIGRPRGLIRYSSQRRLEGDTARRIRPRVVLYPAMLTIVLAGFITALATRADAHVTLLRGAGKPYNVMDDGHIANNLTVKIRNRINKVEDFSIQVLGVDGATVLSDRNPAAIAGFHLDTLPILIQAPPEAFSHAKIDATIRITTDEGFSKDIPVKLFGPRYRPPTD